MMTAEEQIGLEAFADATANKLGEAYAAKAGMQLIPEIIAILGPILLQIITTLLGKCPKPPTPATLREKARKPSLIYRIALLNSTWQVLADHPDVDVDQKLAREVILEQGSTASVDDAAKMLAVAKLVD